MSIAFVVHGIPVGQGSMKSLGPKRIVASNAATLHPWRSVVAIAASQAMRGRALLTGPLHVSVDFGFPRPRSHFDSHGDLRPLAPEYRDSTPDLDKLLRALGDALTGIVWGDDRQVVSITATKPYVDPPVTTVLVEAA